MLWTLCPLDGVNKGLERGVDAADLSQADTSSREQSAGAEPQSQDAVAAFHRKRHGDYRVKV